ncbi:MAG: HNH endonuclease [Candidatus Aenigmatarchaeota archaeon]
MKERILAAVLFLILLSFPVFACQYKENVTISQETKMLPYTIDDKQLQEVIVEIQDVWNAPLKIINPNPADISLFIDVNIQGEGGWVCGYYNQNNIQKLNVNVTKLSSYDLPPSRGTGTTCNSYKFGQNYQITYIDTADVIVKLGTIYNYTEICKGKDDGDPCSIASECGGGFCIEGYCYNSETAKEKTEAIKEKEMREEQATKEKNTQDFIIILITLVIICIVIFWFSRITYGILQQKKIRKELELISNELEKKIKELEKVKAEIDEIKRHKKREEVKLENKLKELKQDEEAINEIKKEAAKKWAELKPFPDKNAENRLVIPNPHLGGYLCFYKKGRGLKDYSIYDSVHWHVWKKRHGRYPRQGYEIHHKDGKKYNNDINNLEELTREEHKKKHHGRINHEI